MTNSTPHFSTFDNQICCVSLGATHGSHDMKGFTFKSPISLNNEMNNISILSIMVGFPVTSSCHTFLFSISFFCRLHLLITLIETSVSMVA